jgi:hypothetical protein
LQVAPKWVVFVVVLLLSFAWIGPDAVAATKSGDKVRAESVEDQALLYLIREKRFQGSARTMFVYADQLLVGVLENNSYTFCYVEPGGHLLWLNWAKINTEVELEAGQTYFFNIGPRGIDDVGEEWGRPLIEAVRWYCTPEDKELHKAESHIAKRYDKAQRVAARKPDEADLAKGSEKRIAKWPLVDLSGYSKLIIAEFELTDPKADTRKKVHQVRSAPARLADAVGTSLDEGVFEEVLRPSAEPVPEGAVELRVQLTQYKPGSRTARFMIAGAGAAHFNFAGQIVDAVTGEVLSEFADKRTWAWGGHMGESFGIEEMERNAALDIALYLERCKRLAAQPDM